MASVSILSFWFLLLAFVTQWAVSVRKFGPYNLRLYEIVHCEDEGTGQVHFGSRINSVGNGKYIYNAPFRFMVPVDDNFTIKMEMSVWSSQGWRPRAYVHSFEGCKAIDSIFGIFYRGILGSAGVNITGCPYPAGNYTANWEITFQLNKIKEAIYKKYKSTYEYSYSKIKVGCLMLIGEVVPKQNTH